MQWLQFNQHALAVNIAVFAVSAVVVWIAGTRIAGYADAIAAKTGIGRAVVGLLLLGAITSLPEVAVTVTASAGGNASLAVNNVLGGVAMQVAILAIADAVIGRDALTSVIADPGVLLQGSLNVLLLALVIAATIVGEIAVFGIGVWAWSLLVFYLGSVWLISRSQGRRAWVAGNDKRDHAVADETPAQSTDRSLRSLIAKTFAAGSVILIAGFVLSKTGEAIADQSGLGQSFAGAVLVAISTSLPEVSTVLAAVWMRRYVMAVSNIFGTNLFDVALIFLIDAVYIGEPVLDHVGRFSTFAALLGIIVTTLFLVGLIERRNRTIARMGIDSFAVLTAYIGGLFVLYTLR